MDKQQIAHILDKEITSINNTLSRLQLAYNRTVDPHQARDLHITISELIQHKKILESVVINIVEDAKLFNPNFNR